MVNLTIHSRIHVNKRFKVTAAILQNITGDLPQIDLDPSQFNILNDQPLANPEFFISFRIDMLLGADVYCDLLCDGLTQLSENLPYLQNTHLGWIVTGKIPRAVAKNILDVNTQVQFSQVSLISCVQENDLNKLVSKFWQTEEIPSTVIRTPENDLAESIFINTTQILPSQTYQVNLPLKLDKGYLKLGDSFNIAHKRFLNIEARLQKNPKLRTDYINFIDEIVDLGHGSYLPLECCTPQGVRCL